MAGKPGTDGLVVHNAIQTVLSAFYSKDGSDGAPGDFGAPGDSIPLSDANLPKYPEQCPCEAAKGPNGDAGSKGNPGNNGINIMAL